MFDFQLNSVHVLKDVAYVENNVVINSIYQVASSGLQRLYWMVNIDRCWIVGKSLVANYQDIVFTLGAIVFMASDVPPIVKIKREHDNPPMHCESSNPLLKLTFIDLRDSSNSLGVSHMEPLCRSLSHQKVDLKPLLRF
jgi:hypothetical protein